MLYDLHPRKNHYKRNSVMLSYKYPPRVWYILALIVSAVVGCMSISNQDKDLSAVPASTYFPHNMYDCSFVQCHPGTAQNERQAKQVWAHRKAWAVREPNLEELMEVAK